MTMLFIALILTFDYLFQVACKN